MGERATADWDGPPYAVSPYSSIVEHPNNPMFPESIHNQSSKRRLSIRYATFVPSGVAVSTHHTGRPCVGMFTLNP